jgi:3-oxoacyl-[acyl-carrier protein] reductase
VRPTDVTDSEQVDGLVAETIAELGRVDVLVSNAGSYAEIAAKPLAELTDAEWHAGVDANLTGAVYCARAVLPHMTQRGSGRIISIASGLGLRARRNDYVYSIAKAGVMQLTRALAVSHGRDGVRATALAPGLFPLEATEQDRASMGARQVAGRVGRPEEVGPVVVFLASDAADYLNGVTLSLDGGASAGGLVPAGLGSPAPVGANVEATTGSAS